MRKIKGVITQIRIAGSPTWNPYNYITVKENIRSINSIRIYHDDKKLKKESKTGARLGLEIEATIEENPSYEDPHSPLNHTTYADLKSIKLGNLNKIARHFIFLWSDANYKGEMPEEEY